MEKNEIENRNRRGKVVGITHDTEARETHEEVMANMDPHHYVSYKRILRYMRKLPKGSTVLIETPKKVIEISGQEPMNYATTFTLIAEKAKELELNVVPYTTDGPIHRRWIAYDLADWSMKENDKQEANKMRKAADVLDPGVSSLTKEERDRRRFAIQEIITDQLLEKMLKYKPALVVGGKYHTDEALKRIKGYSNRTLLRLRLIPRPIRWLGEVINRYKYTENLSKFKAHRDRIMNRHIAFQSV